MHEIDRRSAVLLAKRRAGLAVKIGAVLLAAGGSKRFGDADKLLVEIDGEPLIRRAVAALGASSVSDVVVVSRPDASELVAAADRGRWRFVENPDASIGMSTSLRAGIKALDHDVTGALVALADMPYLTAALVDELCAAFSYCNGEAIVFPESPQGRQGHPVIWPRRFFDELTALDGDQGAKPILLRNRSAWHPAPVANEAAFFDIDTEADLRAARSDDQAMRRK